MFRKMMMFTSALAFALPMALSQPATARPLATPAQPAEWCWGDCDSDGDGDGGGGVGIDIKMKWCVDVLIKSRAEFTSCEVMTGRECLARCTPEAVAASCELDLASGESTRSLTSCQDEQMDACREQCYSGGAAFCERRGGYDDDHDHDYDDDHNEDCPDGERPGYPDRPEWEPEYPDYPDRPEWEPEYPEYPDRPEWEPEYPEYPDRPYDPDRPEWEPEYPEYPDRPEWEPEYPDYPDPERPKPPGFVFVSANICIDLLVKVDVDG